MTEWEPVAIPLAAGLDINTRARLVEPGKLLTAKNCYFPRGGGPEKRKGHISSSVRYGTEVGTSPTDWLYGWGRFSGTSIPYRTPSPAYVSAYPEAGPLLGTATRDSERVAWDGYNLYSKTAYGYTPPVVAQMPAARTETLGKTAQSQSYADAGDNGTIRVLAYRDLSAGTAVVSVYDSATGAHKFSFPSNAPDPEYLRVVPCGAYVQVFVSDITNNVIYHYAIHQEDTGSPDELTEGLNSGAYFDVCKISESLLLLAYVDTSQDVRIAYFNSNGTPYTLGPAANTQLDCSSANVLSVGVDRHPVSNEIGLIWRTSTEQRCRTYTANGVVISSVLVFANDANCSKVGVVASYLTDSAGYGIFYGFSDNTLATNRFVRLRAFYSTEIGLGDGGGTGSTTTYGQRFNVNLIGKPFRVGNVPFVWTCFPSDYQTTFLLMDQLLNPVGKLESGTALQNSADPWMFSTNYTIATNLWETYNFHCALMYKQRVLEVDGIFHEVGTKFCTLDFLPEFRRAQAGRCLYFPGAQLNCYDGKRFAESGFHFAAEDPALTPSNGAGSLTNSGEYNYRIYLCRKNAQGEEVRGPALLTDSVTLGAAEDTVTIVGKTIPTSYEDAYFLIYRQANTGTLWKLVSERDPSSANCPKNDLTQVTWTFVDTVSDVIQETRESDPGNASNYLQYFSAPACETIAYGKNRLWVSGGELPPGTLLPSRLFYPEEVPSFHLNLAHSIDRDNDPITAVGFIADFVVAFKEKRAYIVSGEPADNTSLDDTLRSQLLLSDVGCTSHNSLARLSSGICFQAAGGIRMADASGSLRTIGLDVDPITTYVTDAVLDTENRLVKFYQSDADTLVLDYEGGQWTTWTTRSISASGDTHCHNSELWTVSEGYQDADTNYLHTVRTAHLGSVLGGFNRLRRVGATGESDANYEITLRAYLDENTAAAETWTWNSADDLNTSTWGSGTWGSGFWGDSSGTLLYARDSVWRWRHRLSKQKCSCISIEIEYNGSGRGPIHTALVFEIGRKPGLDRRMK